jgi:hypothetical protein
VSEGNVKDTVSISTMNLDGETNLKEKKRPFLIQSVKDFSGRIECEPPNPNLEAWNGNVFSDGFHKSEKREVINCNI